MKQKITLAAFLIIMLGGLYFGWIIAKFSKRGMIGLSAIDHLVVNSQSFMIGIAVSFIICFFTNNILPESWRL